ncbi:MAG: rhodanese-like domain-containing protein [Alphaproteobacteria bacterium]
MPRKCSPEKCYTSVPVYNNELYKHQINFEEISKDDIILDVRSHSEHAEKALKQPHYLIELNRLNPKEFFENFNVKGKRIYILCGSGYRATQAAQKFEESGYENVAIVKGGISAVCECKLDKSPVISLERQTRIGVGSFVVLSLALGYFISPYFYLATTFFGVGLIYAGVSNFCGLGLLLSKMPWNK